MENAPPAADDFIQAVRFSAPEAVRDLLDRGADANSKNSQGTTALMWAANAGQMETVKLLIDRGAELNRANSQGQTALMWAAIGNRLDAVRLLLAKGADPDQQDHLKRTALSHAMSFNRATLARVLKEERETLIAAEKERVRQAFVMANQQRLKEGAAKRPKIRPAP